MSWSNNPEAVSTDRRRVAPLTVLLGLVTVFFCGILVFVYVATNRANPVMLDQQGRPVDQRQANQ